MSDAIKKGTEMHDALAHRYAAKKPAVGVWVEVISYSDDHWDPTTVVGAVGTIVQIHDRPARTKGAPDTYSVLLTLLNGQKWEDVVFADEVRFLWGGELEALAVLTKNQKLLKERS